MTNQEKPTAESIVVSLAWAKKLGEKLSNCCSAPLSVHTADEGTSCYVCSECKEPCDVATSEQAGEGKCDCLGFCPIVGSTSRYAVVISLLFLVGTTIFIVWDRKKEPEFPFCSSDQMEWSQCIAGIQVRIPKLRKSCSVQNDPENQRPCAPTLHLFKSKDVE